MTSLNPVFTIGNQISEVLMLHEGVTQRAALAEGKRLLEMVRLPDAEGLLKRYPDETIYRDAFVKGHTAQMETVLASYDALQALFPANVIA